MTNRIKTTTTTTTTTTRPVNQTSYHKHHRRKVPSHLGVSSSTGTKLTCERCTMHLAVVSAGCHQSKDAINTTTTTTTRKSSNVSRLHTLTRMMLLMLLLVAFALQLAQPTSAQQPLLVTLQPQRNSHLLPGHNMENLRISELQPVGSVVYQLKAVDKSDPTRKITYALTGDFFSVDEETGEVRLMKQLDRERKAEVSTVVNVLGANSDQPLESRRRNVVIEDADDSWPIFASHKASLVNNPRQGQYVFKAEISELAPVNSVVLSELIVTDADEGANAEIVLECRARTSTNNACDSFAIESRRLHSLSASGGSRYSVTIKTKLSLDYERYQQFKLTLVARGKRASPLKGVPLEAEASVDINVLNVQDEGPTFVNAPYSLSMDESMHEGQRLLRLIVQDGDLAPQRNLSVAVLGGAFSDYFQVSRDPEFVKIWYLETKKTIDREDPKLPFGSTNMFTIHLLAAELNEAGEPMASGPDLEQVLSQESAVYNRMLLTREPVSVMLRDLPDTAPLFVRTTSGELIENNFIAINVSESLATGASVPHLDLSALDLDQGANSRFRLTLVDGDMGPMASEAFALESEIVNGQAEIVVNIVNSSLLDYEDTTKRVFRFHLVASKQAAAPGAQPLVSKLDLQFHLIDANDNWPEFNQDQYQVSIPEGSPPGTLVAQIRAQDRDSGAYGQVNHTLYGMGASKFQVSPRDGKIMVADCALFHCLDHETQASFLLTYVARDGGGHSRNVSVIIQVEDVNDHAPKFQELVYKRELISDNLSSRQNYISPQLIVRAKDDDGPTQGRDNITYRIRSSNLTGLDVDPASGLVYISQPLDLDTLIASSHDLLAPGSASRGPGSGSNLNEINYHQRRIVFEAEVVAEDNGTPSLNSSATILLLVKGNRDGAPQFKQDLYQAYVHESQPAGKPFFQMQAVDPDDKDSQLRYSLGFDPNDLVSIDAHTGQLSFKQRVDFDNFKGVPYNITVYATDNSRPYPLRASAVVSISVQDVNNKPPRFGEREYRALLAQGRTRQGDIVAQVTALDSDLNARLNYSLLADRMSINDRNGQQFTLDDIANTTSGYLAQMTRSDRARMVGDFKRLLAINSRTGAIELKWEPDYSFAASISVRVRVVDLNQEVYTPTGELQEDFAECQLFLQAHIDKSPIFAPPWSHERRDYNISILEELPLETPVFSLLAKDPQTGQRVDLFEKVHDSDPRDHFRVERSTGQVLVNRRIDYEELPASKRLSLTVRAYGNAGGVSNMGEGMPGPNEPAYSTAIINIQVVDLNDNAPEFRNTSYHASVSEAITASHEILTVSAEDRDSSDLGQLYYSLSGFGSHLFHMHPRKGLLTLRKSARLDRDTEADYFLVATASDCNETASYLDSVGLSSLSPQGGGGGGGGGGGPSVAQLSGCKRSSVPVEITVLDENDNDPVFVNTNKRGEYEATSSETVAVGSVITQVVARDPDEGSNGQVAYEIVRTDEPVTRLLAIDHEGYIRASGSLSGAGRPSAYRLTVRAYDAGAKQNRHSFATLLLTISDVVENDGVPRFLRPRPDEIVELPESSGPSTFVYQVQAVDPDEEANGKLMYKFISPSDTFEIDPFTGFIKTQNRPGLFLDRELVPNYTLIIVAQDLGSPPKQAHQVLTIRVGDINDNEPYFEREFEDSPLMLYVEEESPAGTLVGTVQAIDKDIGHNALIGYDIIEGNQDNLFRLNWDSPAAPQVTDEPMLHALHPTTSGNNPCRIYSTGRLDKETRDSYTITIKASSASKMRNQLLHHRDPLGARNPFNQYNVSDLTKLRVTINLIDINDNRPVFVHPNAKSVVDSSAEIYSQLMVLKALDADSSSSEIRYSILDALYYSDSKFAKLPTDSERYGASASARTGGGGEFASMRYVFGVHPTTGILRNSVSLRPFTDGYFEVFIKADSGWAGLSPGAAVPGDTSSTPMLNGVRPSSQDGRCIGPSDTLRDNNTLYSLPPGVDVVDNCHVAVTKVVVFVTHQRETFKFVFNKTKLNDRLDEFKEKVQMALEGIMFEPARVQASIADQSSRTSSLMHEQLNAIRPERVYLNTFNTDFYERDDGSLDFATITSCSQLVKFDDRSTNNGANHLASRQYGSDSSDLTTLVPNQVVSYDDVLSLLKTLNATQVSRQQQHQLLKPSSLFSQYGLVKIERCMPDKTMYKMTLSERLALYFAAMIALVSILLAFIVSKMRKSYEKNLKILQRSKYQYMGAPYA